MKPEMKLWYAERGHGKPLLLVHGFPLEHSMWRYQLEGLADQARLIAPDLRGFGNSQDEDLADVASMEQLADDLANLLDQLNVSEPVVLAGFSMGGYVAWQFWKRHSQRLRALILCDTASTADTAQARQQRLETADQVLSEGVDGLAHAMIKKLFAAEASGGEADKGAHRSPDVAATLEIMRGARPQAVAAALRAMAQRVDATPWLPQITCPCLLICGEHDPITPVEKMQDMAKGLPNARLVVAPGAAHMAPLEQPDLVNREIAAFLGALSGNPETRGA